MRFMTARIVLFWSNVGLSRLTGRSPWSFLVLRSTRKRVDSRGGSAQGSIIIGVRELGVWKDNG
jgi:hypothetical protein